MNWRKDDKNFSVERQRKIFSPRIIIFGVRSGTSKDVIRLMLERKIKEFIFADKIKIIRRMRMNNMLRENIIQIEGVLFKKIMTDKKIDFLDQVLNLDEYVNVIMCYKCCGFGHISFSFHFCLKLRRSGGEWRRFV